MPLAIVVTIALLLVPLAFVQQGCDEDAQSAPPAATAAPVPRIAELVERERGMRFAEPPDVRRVTPAQARAEAAATLDEDYPPARREAESQVLAMLGLLPPGFDLGEATLGNFDEAIAGYYDPRSGALRVIEGAQTGGPVLYESTVAHELAHALDDEHFDLDEDAVAEGGDAGLAYLALVEGSATAVMTRYMAERFSAEEALGASLGSVLAGSGTGTEGMPPFLVAQMLFPYTGGERFVNRLLELGGGGWKVADTAMRFRPPASTEQVLHPEKYVAVEQPDEVAAPSLPGWKALSRSTMGEWLTARLLAGAGGTRAGAAAAGWGGDAYALLGRGDERALGVRWRWDSPRDAREFARALRAWAEDGMPESEPMGRDAWRGRDGVAVVRDGRDEVALAIAPDLATARALAR
ncbi:MAG: hypothetical protein ABWZ67_04880 [Solirubrobacteraceae bacterium]